MAQERDGNGFLDAVNRSPLSWLIAAVNLGIFTLAWIRGGSAGLGVDTEVLLNLGASNRYYVQSGDFWRLLTAVFLHSDWVHVLVNTVFMFSWCAMVERTVGSAWFAFAYLTMGVGSFAVSVLGRPGTSVGASGAGFGMIAVVLAMLYRREGSWNNFTSNPYVRSIVSQVAFWILIGFFVLRGMDNFAHVGGLVLGMGCGLVLERRRGRHEVKWMVSLGAYILVWLGLVVAACIPGMGFGKPGG